MSLDLTKEPNELFLTVKFSLEGDHWIARCNELDIVCEEIELHDAVRRIGELCATQIQYAKENGNWKYL